ncbi:TetR/AcrR family transcriptional regulator [Motiliproteus sp. SC1-56]|uniref:TetR/AcrR family transcriptional regulator n=1 Tax=Motiliproteus sp. SC1-56 TaxID=2799565 RepID=UPI001A8D8D89|nr:TetR/AcrR family transcriptional regulator [Motiliproteus sp. SC1-56]
MTVAQALFYAQGFKATGINEVIEKSGVAKATFYNHFRTKDELGAAYIKAMKESEVAYLEGCLAGKRDPVERFLAVIESLRPWLLETEFRGCPFINLASEVPDAASPLRREGTKLYDFTRDKTRILTGELIASDPETYGHLDVDEVTDTYMTLYAGAIALAEIYHAIWPIDHALQGAKRLIGK